MPASKLILVTGGTGGLALALAKALQTSSSKQEYTVLLGGRTLDKAVAAVKEVTNGSKGTASGSELIPVELDIDNDESVTKLAEWISSQYGHLDVLLHMASAHLDGPLSKKEVTFRKAVAATTNTNLASTWLATEAFMPLLFHSSEPRLIFLSTGISSLTEHADQKYPVNKPWAKGWPKKPEFAASVYRASKSGLNMLILEWAKMLAEDPVKIHILDPGFLATPLGGYGAENLRAMGAEDPSVGADFVLSVLKGEHDEHTNVMLGREGVIPCVHLVSVNLADPHVNGFLDLSDVSHSLEEASLAETLTPLQLLSDFETINVAAPLVRYSKSAWRKLVGEYDAHLTHTPMILAQEFGRSAVARNADFSLFPDERGTHEMAELSLGSCHAEEMGHRSKRRRLVKGVLVAQFGANKAEELAEAAELISPFVDGIDLNCGCPVRSHAGGPNGIGSALLRQPELVRDMIHTTKSRTSKTVSLKIRLDPDLKRTDALVRIAQHAGADYITIHGRTRHQASTEPVDEDGLAFAADIARQCGLPAVANGDVFDLAEAERVRQRCRVRAVMSARGLLANPTLFAGYEYTPDEAIERFFGYAIQSGLPWPLAHRQLSYMLESRFKRPERLLFNSLPSYASALDTLSEWDIVKHVV